MKYTISMAMVLGVSLTAGCNAPAQAPATPKSATVATAAAPSCVFDSMVLNGLSATDPARTGYLCHSTPSNATTDQQVPIALRSDGTGYFGIGTPGGSVTRNTIYWGTDSNNCEIVIMTAPASGEIYRLRAPLLGAGNKLSAVDVRNSSSGAILPTSACYFDTTPGM